ncbi:hypothetical protein [Candidatus Pantoea bituminis]|uniref:hypothetical protein n=1 Tax=Candidatus Pantoea bituminis TaxID=2831036 RepID=UPI00208F8D23|nr:hypothetical protein [Pantoea bituminis]
MSATDMNEPDTVKINAEIARLMAETQRLNAEANKFNRETLWYPLAVASGLLGAVAAVTAIIIKYIA